MALSSQLDRLKAKINGNLTSLTASGDPMKNPIVEEMLEMRREE
ncbi:hypothetical protein SAMN05192555_1087 [Franzmannia pantelleriensis]|uniref:Uncharacterized protein n=1 Tax=Franzmannia pantelleriensis TaxID=48727 RepID=A0A1G9P614_9GAMM|nr:hypothetical protein SAMN05192555_1087 [Halomonas pantelleriensis]